MYLMNKMSANTTTIIYCTQGGVIAYVSTVLESCLSQPEAMQFVSTLAIPV